MRQHIQSLQHHQPFPLSSSPVISNALIAGTAKVHDLCVVTRNASVFANLGVDVTNPWEITNPWKTP